MSGRLEDINTDLAAIEAGLSDERHDEQVLIARIKNLRVRARSAMNWLEDTEEFELAHEILDRVGRIAREKFPDELCVLAYEDGTYYEDCAVTLAHVRVGLSIAYVVKEARCSICDRDPWDCDHITGREYNGEYCYRIITEAEVFEVSLVPRPAQPDARIMRVSMNTSELIEGLGPGFQVGMGVLCDKCLSDCPGVNRAFEERDPFRADSSPTEFGN